MPLEQYDQFTVFVNSALDLWNLTLARPHWLNSSLMSFETRLVNSVALIKPPAISDIIQPLYLEFFTQGLNKTNKVTVMHMDKKKFKN